MKSTAEDKRVELLLGITNPEDEIKLTDIINQMATAVHFSGVGYGTARQNYLAYFGLGEINKRVTTSLIPAAQAREILSAIGHGLKLYLVGRGIAFTVPLSGISNIIGDAIISGVDKSSSPIGRNLNKSKKEKKIMHELVIAVVNRKYTDAAIEAARAAGADTYLSGELSYHILLDAPEKEINLIEAGHFYTEKYITARFTEILQKICPQIETEIKDSTVISAL